MTSQIFSISLVYSNNQPRKGVSTMPMPKENDQVTGNKGTYIIGKFISKGPTAVSHVATDSTGRKMFLKAYLSPKSSSGMYKAYLDYEVELNRRLENDHDLKQQSVYAEDVFSAPLVSNGRKNPFPMLFQVFPFVSGNINLSDLIEDGFDGRPLTWDERKMAANIFTFAMSRLHRVKIVHGDLKPENVQVTRVTTTDGSLLLKPLLVDMDGSVLADRPAPWAEIDERTGEKYSGYVGTAGYFSPEHLRGKVPVPASDVFTASIILCQLLAGVHPFSSSLEDGGDGYPKAAVAGRHDFLRQKIPFLGEIPEDRRVVLENLLKAAWSSDPGKRPTMNELHEEVVRLRKAMPSPPKCPRCRHFPCICPKPPPPPPKCPRCGHSPCVCPTPPPPPPRVRDADIPHAFVPSQRGG